jgi:hypothetical protein
VQQKKIANLEKVARLHSELGAEKQKTEAVMNIALHLSASSLGADDGSACKRRREFRELIGRRMLRGAIGEI